MELPDPSGPLSKVISLSSIASYNTEVTKMLKQTKRSVTKNCYTKLTPAIVGSHTCGNHAFLWLRKMNTSLNLRDQAIIPQ